MPITRGETWYGYFVVLLIFVALGFAGTSDLQTMADVQPIVRMAGK